MCTVTRDSAYNAITYVYRKIKGPALSVEFESFDDFYNWSIESGWEYGKKLRRLNSNEGYTRENCIWMDAEYARRYDRRDYFSVDKWDETVARIRECLKNLPPYDPVKQQRNGREFFQYEHPDLEREGIVFEGSGSV